MNGVLEVGDLTSRFKLSTLGPGDQLQDDGYKFTDSDVRLVDRVLEYAAELHTHSGDSSIDSSPSSGLETTLYTTGGTLPAGIRVFYRYSLIDSNGFESAASPISYISMPDPIVEPDMPALSYTASGGTLQPGQYGYILTAYKTSSTIETKGTNANLILVNQTTALNEITLSMPSLPSGATGFNIYKRGPSSPGYYFLASTASSSYVDDGSVSVNTARTIPKSNTTNAQNAVDVNIPGATPTVPAGFTWRVYRTLNAANWDASVLADVTDGDPTYSDVGASTTVGAPLSASQQLGSPPKINLTDVSEVQGYLPPGRNVVPYVASFVIPGPVSVGSGEFVWVCDFDQADIVSCRAYLGVDSTPFSTNVIVDVNRYCPDAATPAWATIFTTQANRPFVPVGEQIGDPAVPDVVHLTQGCMLSVDVDQDGGGSTPTDENLVVNILMYVQLGSITTSHTWGTS